MLGQNGFAGVHTVGLNVSSVKYPVEFVKPGDIVVVDNIYLLCVRLDTTELGFANLYTGIVSAQMKASFVPATVEFEKVVSSFSDIGQVTVLPVGAEITLTIN